MSRIISPLRIRMKGSDVSDLHEALIDLGFAIVEHERTNRIFGGSTKNAVAAFQRCHHIEPSGEVDRISAAAINRALADLEPGPSDDDTRFLVKGTISHPNGKAADGVIVHVFDKDLRTEQLLGKTSTDAKGYYEIVYSPQQFLRAEKLRADLLIRIADARGQLLYSTPINDIRFNAPRIYVFDIILESGDTSKVSEFELLKRTLEALSGDVPINDLKEDEETPDITFLHRETGWAEEMIEYMVISHRLSKLSEFPPEFFYALLRKNTLLLMDISSALRCRLSVTIQSDTKLLFHQITLLEPEIIKKDVGHAVEDNIVPESLAGRIDSIIDQVTSLREESETYLRREEPRRVLGLIERNLKEGKIEEALDFLQHGSQDTTSDLFKKLTQASGFLSKDDEDEARTNVQLAQVLGFDDDIIDQVREHQGISGSEEIYRLARLDKKGWTTVLTEAANTIRPGGERLNTELIDFHASSLVRKMEKRFPTVAFAAQLERDEESILPHGDKLVTLFNSHPELDLTTTHMERFFSRNGVADLLADDSDGVKDTLKRVQRVFKLSQNYTKTKSLINEGIHSAQSIVSMGEAQFVHRFGGNGSFTHTEARNVYRKAADIHTASLILATDIRSAVNVSAVHTLSDLLSPEKLQSVHDDFPTLKNLFQHTDLCSCEHCRSVYSPAAYLVDVLQFIKKRLVLNTETSPSSSVKIAKDVLFDRRPDLGDLDLSCENTDTPLPYIDIVCELLEELVAPDPGIAYSGSVSPGKVPNSLRSLLEAEKYPISDTATIYEKDSEGNFVLRDKDFVFKVCPTSPGQWVLKRIRQTHKSAEELKAAPEYLNEDAYTALQGSRYAFSLPFDLSHREAQGYLTQFDIKRSDLMEAFRHNGDPTDCSIAADALGISDDERKLIVTPDPSHQNLYWNTTSTPASDEMKVVDTFLTKSELTYEQLQELLQQSWIDPDDSLFIQHLALSCDTAERHISGLDDAGLDRIHRFLRLWRRIQWPMPVLNNAIISARLGNGMLDDDCLVKIDDLRRLRSLVGLSIEEVSIFYGEIPRDGENSRYEQLFLNQAATGVIDERFLVKNVTANETAPPSSQIELSDCRDTLLICLGLKPDDLDLLLSRLPDPAILSFANLASLYAIMLLCGKLGLKIDEYGILCDLTVPAVFENPELTIDFINEVKLLNTAGISTYDLQYLLRHEAPDLDTRTMTEKDITTLLTRLQELYQQAFEETRTPYDETKTADENKNSLKDLLSKLPSFDETELAAFLSIVDNEWQNPDQTPAEFIDEKLGELTDTTDIKTALAGLSVPGDPEKQRSTLIQAVLDTLAEYFFQREQESLLTDVLTESMGLDEEIAPVLLNYAHLKQPPSAGNPVLLAVLTTYDLIDADQTPPIPPAVTLSGFPYQYAAIQLLHKMTFLIQNLRLRSDEIHWMLEYNPALEWLELDNLPYESGLETIDYEHWKRLQDALFLIRLYPPVEDPNDLERTLTFYTLLEYVLDPGTTTAEFLQLVAIVFGWDETDVVSVDAHLGLSTPDLSEYRKPATYRKLERSVVFLRRLGIDVSTAHDLVQPKLTRTDVQALRLGLKTRYDESQWLDVLRGIQDGLRIEKRDALVAHILAEHPEYNSSNDLYDDLLIDVEMSSCQPTSRIVQAHGTVQLFVQRCLMGLESRAVADVNIDPDWEQWKWMKNYRVWEVNRKIFLYPENWIEPELRDDKSFLFTELENELLQNELTERVVEEATVHYLEKLDEIARLEVCALYYETDIFTMHVFARTKGDPAVYYYRCLERERYWTPWEKIDLDIAGDHLMAFERNKRLYLAWPLFFEEPREDQDIEVPPPPTTGVDVDKTEKQWRVQLAVSERAGNRWLPKKVSKDALFTNNYYVILPKKEDFRFTVTDLKQNGFFIYCTYLENGQALGGYWDQQSTTKAYLGRFRLTGCKGYPEPDVTGGGFPGFDFSPEFKDTAYKNLRYRERVSDAENDLAIKTIFHFFNFLPIVQQTPGVFQVTYPHQLSMIDIILVLIQILVQSITMKYKTHDIRHFIVPVGTFMPFFYEDHFRNFTVLPGFYGRIRNDEDGEYIQKTFSDILQFVKDCVALLMKYWFQWKDTPGTDLEEILEDLVKDSEYIRLYEEFKSYRSLKPGYQFRTFYHPFVCGLRTAISEGGIPGLMRHEVQMQNTGFNFGLPSTYAPTPLVAQPFPEEDVDFRRSGSYASYNWELFFHLPFLVGVKLTQDQQYEEAMRWYHYIFNPTGALEGDAPNKYWVTKPFYLYQTSDYEEQRIDTILYDLAEDPSGATLDNLKFAVEEWRSKPFRPHVIARSRPVAYQISVVLKYIDNLIEWGDFLFRQDTMESVNEATQLYILAEKLLGPRPRIVPPVVEPPPMSYNQLETDIDLFGNVLLNELENLIPDLDLLPQGGAELPPSPVTLSTLYFCIPHNTQLLEYWDRVADRLFKIRHCQNIEGIERILALFAPPIDPGALVRAVAAGLDIASVISGLSAPTPHYRFNVISQKATELIQEVRSLGSALLQALEKKDAEELALLRSTQEQQILEAIKAVKELQIEESEEAIKSIERSMEIIEERRNHYSGLDFMNSWETASVGLSIASTVFDTIIALGYVLSGSLKLLPQFMIGAAGFGGTPTAEAETGGHSFGDSMEDLVQSLSAIARTLDKISALTATQGTFQRRQEDWDLQVRLADRELAHLQQQIVAAEIRRDIAKKDLENHELQIKNAKAIDDYMRSKFSNKELYQWMINQISLVYFRAYKLAFDVAKKAERSYRHELGLSDSFIQFGYWDSLKKGLLSADRLLHDVKRMEVAYLDKNKREYELTKHVSLGLLDPLALVQLKNTGRCTFTIPEAVFDMDHPGHYMRRLKSVSLSVPCVVGSYGSVNCKLSLVSNQYRKNSKLNTAGTTDREKYQEIVGNDDRFVYNVGTIQSIATSTGRSDSGLFELNFSDQRYLPFEGAGAISTWHLEMPMVFKSFDYDTISDVIVHLHYTARDGGSGFKSLTEAALRELLNEIVLYSGETGLFQAFDLKREFSHEWNHLKAEGNASVTIDECHMQQFTEGHDPTIQGVTWLARVKGDPPTFAMSLNGVPFDLTRNPDLNNLCEGPSDLITLGASFDLSVDHPDDLDELMIVVTYTLST